MQHQKRRLSIVSKHGDSLKEVPHYDSHSQIYILVVVFLHLCTAYHAYDLSLPNLLILSWFGGFFVNFLTLGIHECCHNSVAASRSVNIAFSFIANVPLVVPFASKFFSYHPLHHTHLGNVTYDVDIPTVFEFKYMLNNLTGRFLWILFQPVFYSLRPMLVLPLRISKRDLMNLSVQLCFFFIALKLKLSIQYLLISLFLGLSVLNPCAGHFLTEHFGTGETGDYRGLLNNICFNVGYHTAHHDIPSIPGSSLPKLLSIAPEFYEEVQISTSWIGEMFLFVLYGEESIRRREERIKVLNSPPHRNRRREESQK
jgi:sphingolipid delta-4 desaturase